MRKASGPLDLRSSYAVLTCVPLSPARTFGRARSCTRAVVWVVVYVWVL